MNWTSWLFLGTTIAFIIAYLTKRTTVVSIDKENNIKVKKQKIKGDNDTMQTTPTINIDKSKIDKPDKKNKRKRIFNKNKNRRTKK